MTRWHWRAAVPALAAAGIVLAPLATVTMSTRAALVARAVATLALTLVAVALSLWRAGSRSALGGVGKRIAFGLGLYVLAVGLGAAVALVRGNDPVRLAGQLLSLGLLPLAASTLVSGEPGNHWWSLATGVAAAYSLAAVVQLMVAMLWLGRTFGDRLIFGNAVSFGDFAPLAVALGPCLMRGAGAVRRILGVAVVPLALVLAVLTQIRTHLIGVLVVGIVVVSVALVRGDHPLRRLAFTAASATIAVALLLAAAWLWWRAPREEIAVERLAAAAPAAPDLPGNPSRARATFVPVARFTAPPGRLVRVRGQAACDSASWTRVVLRRETSGAELHRSALTDAQHGSSIPFPFVLLASGDGGALVLGTLRLPGAPCRLVSVTAEDLGPAAVGALASPLLVVLRRPPDPDPAALPGPFAADASLAFRYKEARALAAAMRSASPAELVFGHGLGATYRIDAAGFDKLGRVVPFGETNFIHNLYLFLPFKLGVLGTALYLGALATWVVATLQAALACPPGSGERVFGAGATAIWVSYAVMGVAAPHLITFSSTPLLGFLLAATGSGLRPWAPGVSSVRNATAQA